VRLDRLDVTGFGCLRDVIVDFHPRVTVISGDNESGKSTLHRAVRAALYGIDAGGQGRAVDRSEWARWTPWTAGAYGIALIYVLDDGRKLRVARRLDSREQSVQVLEIGGSEMTDELRRGRAVVPGQFHLGIDESVFCATAWLGDDGLRLASPEAAAQRSDRLQEAIERLADTRRGVTAAEALVRLREAGERVGSERRSSSELGAATARMRELDGRLIEARRRLTTVAAEQQRLRDLDVRSAAEAERRTVAERALLVARLAEVRERRRLLDEARVEAAQHAAAVAQNDHYAAFPIEAEGMVLALGGELTRAGIEAAEAQARWDTAQEQSRPARRRRAEIAAGLAALPLPTTLPDDAGERSQRLRGELSAVEVSAQRLPSDAVSGARTEALQREIAATGLRGVATESVDHLLGLLAAARSHASRWTAAATAVASLAGAAFVLLGQHNRLLIAALSAAAGALLAGALVFKAAHTARAAAVARRHAGALAAQAGLTLSEVTRLAGRLPTLHALSEALARERASVEGRRAEVEAVRATAAALWQRCHTLVEASDIEATAQPSSTGIDAQLRSAGELLDSVDAAVVARRRRNQLESEDTQLGAQEKSYQLLAEQATRSAAAVAALDERLRQVISNAGLPQSDSPVQSVEAFRAAADACRRRQAGLRALAEIDQRMRALGDDEVLQRLDDDLVAELQARGGQIAEINTVALPDAAALRRLDIDAEHARQGWHSVSEQAREARARLEGSLQHVPSIADLEDERDACAAVRARSLQRLAALQRAGALIEEASRVTHRDLAPQLARWVGSRLTLLTDSRYAEVNVDTEHFAISLLGRERPDMVPLEHASHGTRDQVSLLLRLALCETMSGSGERVPLLLDEPMLTADPRRREVLVEFLHRLSETHQVVLTTADPEVGDLVRRVAGDDCAVVTIGGPQGVVRAPKVAEKVGRHAARVRVV